MEGALKVLFFLFAVFAAIAAAVMIAVAIGVLYLFSLSLGKAAKFDFDEVFEVATFVYFIQSFTMAIGFFVVWMQADDGTGSTFWISIGAIASGIIWPISVFFCMESTPYSTMALWATGLAIVASQAFVIFKVLRKTQRVVDL